MTRERYVSALRACAKTAGSTISIRAQEAAFLADLLEEPRRPPDGAVDHYWILTQYQTSLGMLGSWKGDTLVERLSGALLEYDRLEKWKVLALGTLLDLKNTLGVVVEEIRVR